jgi:ribosome-binding factor A
MAGHRPERIAEQIRQEISIMFAREVSDPRLANANVTRVEVTGDLRIAKIFVTPRDDKEETAAMMSALKRAAGYFRHQIAESMDLRLAPEIRFFLDYSIEKGEHFLRALEQVQAEERALATSRKRSRKKG